MSGSVTFPANTVRRPFPIQQWLSSGCHHHNVLHVTPCQTWTINNNNNTSCVKYLTCNSSEEIYIEISKKVMTIKIEANENR